MSQALLQRRKDTAGTLPRVAAPLVEGLVLRCVMAFDTGNSPDASQAARAELVHSRVRSIVVGANVLVIEINVGKENVGTDGNLKRLHSALPTGATLAPTAQGVRIAIAGPLKRHGGIKSVEGWAKEDWSSSLPRVDQVLVAALARAHRWRTEIERGDVVNVDDLAKRARLHRRRVRELLRLAFLAPDIQRAIVEGRQPRGLNLERLIEVGPPASWHEQRRLLGLA